MVLQGNMERVRLERNLCTGELRIPGVFALRHSSMAFHMSVPSFTSLSCRTHSVLKTMSFRAEPACPESNDGELLSTNWKVIFFLFLSLHSVVLLCPKFEVWNCHTASTLCETAVVVLL